MRLEVKFCRSGSDFCSCWLKSAVTGNPCSATEMADLRSAPKLLLPYSETALAQVATVPGTPTDSPDRRASSKASGLPVFGSMKKLGLQAAGHISRPSMVTT